MKTEVYFSTDTYSNSFVDITHYRLMFKDTETLSCEVLLERQRTLRYEKRL